MYSALKLSMVCSTVSKISEEKKLVHMKFVDVFIQHQETNFKYVVEMTNHQQTTKILCVINLNAYTG
jgi:hypothetical protein